MFVGQPYATQQFFDSNGDPLSGGLIYTYAAGTTTPQATYTDHTGGTPNANPVVLDSRGEAKIYMDASLEYYVVVKNSAGVQQYTEDKIGQRDDVTLVTDIVTLRAISPTNGRYIDIKYHTSASAGGGGRFRGVTGASPGTYTHNNGSIVVPSGGNGSAAWIMVDDNINIRQFGAIGDGTTDDTVKIQAAIDYAYSNGVGIAKSVYVPSGNYVCGQITTYPYTTIIGTGRHTSNFYCKSGTTGKWWSDRGNGAQKLMLSGLAFYANNEAGLTHVAEFGNDGVQFGSEGILQGLWFRDCYNAYGLLCDANVGIFSDITVQNCQYGAKIIGNANHVQNLYAMQCDTIGIDLSGCFARGLHTEATLTGGIPIKINGDTNIKDITISTATGFTHSRLIEVDTGTYTNEWSIENIILLGSGYTVTDGILKVGANYYGGTTPSEFTGTSYVPSLTVYDPKIEMAYQRLQAFNIRIYNDGGTIKHRFGSSGDSGIATNLKSKVNGSSTTLTATPTGANATTAFAAGAKIGNPNTSLLIIDTASQLNANAVLTASISYNSSTSSLNVWPQILSENINGVTRPRFCIQFTNVNTGANYDITTLPVGSIVEINVMAFLA